LRLANGEAYNRYHLKTPHFLKRLTACLPVLLDVLNRVGIKRDFEIKTFLREIQPGQVVWDVGANRGRFTELFCLRVGGRGQVIAIEPLTLNFKQLDRLRYPQLRKHQMGLSQEPGAATFYFPPDDGAQASLNKQDFGNWVGQDQLGEERCRLETLDRLMLQEKWPMPHFIKMDAEGAEYQILVGGKTVLSSHSITLFIELNQETLRSFQVTLENIWNLLQTLGYRHFSLVGRQSELAIPDLQALTIGMQKHFSPCLLCRKGR
jgi:FkbM family methyltransferase